MGGGMIVGPTVGGGNVGTAVGGGAVGTAVGGADVGVFVGTTGVLVAVGTGTGVLAAQIGVYPGSQVTTGGFAQTVPASVRTIANAISRTILTPKMGAEAGPQPPIVYEIVTVSVTVN
jgi:hypothetical protein